MIRGVFLRTASIVLSSFGIILSLLAIFVRTLVPSYAKASTPQTTWFKPIPQATGTPRRRMAHPLQRSLSVPVISSCPRSDIMLSSIIDGAVPHIHAPAHATESSIHQSNLIEVSADIYEVSKGTPVLRPPSIIAYRAIVSPASRQRSDRLRCKRSVEFLLRFSTRGSSSPLKNSIHLPDPPLRTQPYAAPYFFPAPGTPEAIDYVRKTREELLRPGRSSALCKRDRNARTSGGACI